MKTILLSAFYYALLVFPSYLKNYNFCCFVNNIMCFCLLVCLQLCDVYREQKTMICLLTLFYLFTNSEYLCNSLIHFLFAFYTLSGRKDIIFYGARVRARSHSQRHICPFPINAKQFRISNGICTSYCKSYTCNVVLREEFLLM